MSKHGIYFYDISRQKKDDPDRGIKPATRVSSYVSRKFLYIVTIIAKKIATSVRPTSDSMPYIIYLLQHITYGILIMERDIPMSHQQHLHRLLIATIRGLHIVKLLTHTEAIVLIEFYASLGIRSYRRFHLKKHVLTYRLEKMTKHLTPYIVAPPFGNHSKVLHVCIALKFPIR